MVRWPSSPAMPVPPRNSRRRSPARADTGRDLHVGHAGGPRRRRGGARPGRRGWRRCRRGRAAEPVARRRAGRRRPPSPGGSGRAGRARRPRSGAGRPSPMAEHVARAPPRARAAAGRGSCLGGEGPSSERVRRREGWRALGERRVPLRSPRATREVACARTSMPAMSPARREMRTVVPRRPRPAVVSTRPAPASSRTMLDTVAGARLVAPGDLGLGDRRLATCGPAGLG